MHNNPFDDPFQAHAGPATPDIFRRPRSGGVPRSRKPNASAETDAGSEPVPEPLVPEDQEAQAEGPKAEENPADKVILRNPKWDVETVGFNEETEISVAAELPESLAHRTRVDFELFAETPKGPESISKGQGNIQGGRAVCKIPVYIPQFKDEFGNLLDKVKYFFSARHSASDPLKDETVTKEVKEPADRLLACHILQDITFATGKSQVSPRHAPALKEMVTRIQEWKKKHPDGKLAVFGHADAVGKEDANKRLSERRAKAIFAFLVKDVDIWKTLYDEEKWGLASTQELLKHLGQDPGAIDGQDGPKTQGAVKTFQGKRGLPASGNADAATRAALYAAFMEECNPKALASKDFDSLDGQPFTGCSEFNLVEKVEGASEANRRVAVVLLKSNRNFPVQYPCKQGDIAPCRKQVGRKGERRTAGFGCLFYDQLVVETGDGMGASHPKSGTLKLVGIMDGETVKQYVNLEPGELGEGPERRIEVEVTGVADGTMVFWKAKAGKDNSKRSSPKPGLKIDAQGSLEEFKDGVAELETEVKGGKTACSVFCGLAGGNSYGIEIGLARGKCDTKFQLETWRRLWYETIQPEADGKRPVTGYTVFKADKSPGLSDQSQAYLTRVLGDGFVEFEQRHGMNFGIGDLPASGQFNVFDGGYVGKQKGKPLCVLTFNQLDSILTRKARLNSDQRCVSIIWTDYLAEMAKWQENFQEISRSETVTTSLAVFEHVIDRFGGYDHGAYSIRKLSWKATHWMDNELGEWQPIVSRNDPGWDFRNGENLEVTEDIRAHVEFVGIRRITLKFPETKGHYPGKRIGKDETGRFVDKGANIALAITLEGVACETRINGAAKRGNIWMNTFAGDADVIGVAGVIAHELGHNMGQAYADNSVDKIFGRPKSKPIPGIPFPKAVPQGDVYGERGHRGTHCAKGVKNKGAKNYSAEECTAFAEHECIMFGASDMSDSKEFTFCPDCVQYIRAEDLQDIRKPWNT